MVCWWLTLSHSKRTKVMVRDSKRTKVMVADSKRTKVMVADVESLKENQSDAAIHDAHHLAYLSTHYLQLVMSSV
jgi:hypothetical protein